jgi:hypothetical protein
MVKAVHPLMAGENTERTIISARWAEGACRSYNLASHFADHN